MVRNFSGHSVIQQQCDSATVWLGHCVVWSLCGSATCFRLTVDSVESGSQSKVDTVEKSETIQ